MYTTRSEKKENIPKRTMRITLRVTLLLYELVSTGQVLTRPTLERLYVPLSEGSRLKFEEHREIADETEMYRVGLTRRVT